MLNLLKYHYQNITRQTGSHLHATYSIELLFFKDSSCCKYCKVLYFMSGSLVGKVPGLVTD